MIRWRCFLFLAMLLVPVITGAKSSANNDDDEEERNNENDEEEEDDDDDDDEAPPEREKSYPRRSAVRRVGNILPSTLATETTPTVPRAPLECFVCSYQSDNSLKACLDPNRYRVHTMYCHSVDDKCFTSITAKDNTYESVVRGCRSGCYATAETTCCESNRCNNQALVIPVQPTPRARDDSQGSSSSMAQNKSSVPFVFFFVTILLLLQTVVKVAIV